MKNEILEIAKDILHKHVTNCDVGDGDLLEALMKIRNIIESEIQPGDVAIHTDYLQAHFFVVESIDGGFCCTTTIKGPEGCKVWQSFKKESCQKCPPEIEPQIRALLKT